MSDWAFEPADSHGRKIKNINQAPPLLPNVESKNKNQIKAMFYDMYAVLNTISSYN